ncbi:SUKH-4 family immunity protein [Streptomyces endophytica]|uniref:SUKH-4 family immunity protein n=1 Tax=Streptomyces endophytica TaxID=2991496 RepID=A0ABY6PCH6_9ACTN|nr:SUKH-4 family immunity protein [Streptomyces endophytica]UZJ31476.1 SUKH-4 family immunity protein [Streptomyces endophytica]
MALVSAWRQNWRPGDKWAHLVATSGTAAVAVLEDIHRQTEGSVLVDAAGRTTEEVFSEVLRLLGVDLSPGKRSRWRTALRRQNAGRLVLIANAHQAGSTRGSSEPDQLLSQAARSLSRFQLVVVLHHTPDRLPRRPKTVFHLQGPEHGHGADEADRPAPLRALALARPRVVPMCVWAELTAALGPEPATEPVLRGLLEEFSDHLVSGEHGVAFVDEDLAEALRRDASDEEVGRVDRHMAAWLLRKSPEFRHAEGWAKSGPEGRYAAMGLAMHAAQAQVAAAGSFGEEQQGPFAELLRDGGTVANIPQTTLLDAARCAFLDDLPGNSAAGAALYLWSYGVIPAHQQEWAAWLHLMATARGDHAFAAAVAASGVRLPWKAKWTHWRPPGGCHWRYLEPGRIDGLTEVRWQGRAAVASLYTESARADIWDADTGEHLAGPWNDEIPEEHHGDLSWRSASGNDLPGPESVEDLEEAMSEEESVHDLLLDSPALFIGNQVILGGSGGLFAIEPTRPEPERGSFSLPNYANQEPFTGSYDLASAVTPVDAPPPSPADLAEIYGAHHIHSFPEHTLPEGLTDESTRRTLIEFGLPAMSDENGMGIYPFGDHRMTVFDEIPWPSDITPAAESGPFFQIGFWMGGKLVIDGPTGHVLRIPSEPDEDHLAALPAAQSLENFLTMVALWITGHLTKELIDGDDEAYLVPHHVLTAHRHIDPTGAEAPAWAYAFHNP